MNKNEETILKIVNFLLFINPQVTHRENNKFVATVSLIYQSDLQKLSIRPTKVVHPNYKSYASEQQQSTIVVHPTYYRCAPTYKRVQPTYSRSDTLTFFQFSVYPTYRSSDQLQLEVAEKPHAGSSEVS